MNRQKQKVLVAMSGGVDSSVAAALLKKDGYEITGAFIKGWYPDWLQCDWRGERQDAMRVCATLDVSFKTVDLSKEYKQEVVDYMIGEYSVGRTPNPDVMCNKKIKFGAFMKKAEELGMNMIATGHHARVARVLKTSDYQLMAGADNAKDQSYFLWTLTQKTLKRTLFPIGEYKKDKVRKLAKQFGLHTTQKKDSQGLCFIGRVDMQEFLKHYIDIEEGSVLNIKGEVIGSHVGAIIYTIGQRHGFNVVKKGSESGPWYVVGKDIDQNTITVSESYKRDDSFAIESVELESINWIGDEPKEKIKFKARIRYRQPLQTCRIETSRKSKVESQTWRVIFDKLQRGVASGQSCVVYDGEVCLGGGVIL